MGRALREKHRLKTRQPLKTITVVSAEADSKNLLMSHAELITSELNIRELVILDSANSLCDMSSKPKILNLGPKLGKDMGAVGKAIEALSMAQIAELEAGKNIMLLGQ